MRSLTGLLLLIAGLGVGAHAYYPDTVERHVHLAQVARILTPSAPDRRIVERVEPSKLQSFSPGSSLITTGSIDARPAVQVVKAPAQPILTSAPKLLRRADRWGGRVVHSTVGTGPTGGLATGAAMSDAERWRLVRDVQSELRRVGCYFGKIDGSWGAGSKRSLGEFLRAVNSSLPVDRPDQILLTLLRSHGSTVCGQPRTTIAKQTPESGGAIVAPPARLVRTGTTESGIVVVSRPQEPIKRTARTRRNVNFDGRMAVGGPPPGRVGARYSAPGVSAVPPLVRAAPTAVERPAPVRAKKTNRARPKRAKKPRPAKYSKKAQRRVSKKRRVSSKRARRRSLQRQAFGESF
ncbi:MAG: hypothetical protein K0U74_01420 [Alphaproteobacteria bacterium]|nr:hypothetical protein [Alphaproteobacteria bacterium]